MRPLQNTMRLARVYDKLSRDAESDPSGERAAAVACRSSTASSMLSVHISFKSAPGIHAPISFEGRAARRF